MLRTPHEHPARDGGGDHNGNCSTTHGERPWCFGQEPRQIDCREKIEHPEHTRRLELQRKRDTGDHERPGDEKDRDERGRPGKQAHLAPQRETALPAQHVHHKRHDEIAEIHNPERDVPVGRKNVILACHRRGPEWIHAIEVSAQGSKRHRPSREHETNRGERGKRHTP
jgi:hypothetical protein